MIVLFTDFGLAGPYTGQMKTVLAREAPGIPVIDLFADAPSRHPKAAAYLFDGVASSGLRVGPWAGNACVAMQNGKAAEDRMVDRYRIRVPVLP